MKDINTNSDSSGFPAGARIDVTELTDKQISDMQKEFWQKAEELKEFFTRMSAILDDSAGVISSETQTPLPQPANSSRDAVQAFKKRELEKLGLDYIIPVLEQEAQA